MGDGPSTPAGGNRPPAAPTATRLESAEDLRRALAEPPSATVLENVAAPAADRNVSATRLESIDDIRKAMAAPHPATVMETPPPKPELKPRDATRLESVEEIRKVLADKKSVLATPQVSGTVLFRPARRPPVAILTIRDDGVSDGEHIRLRGDRTVIGRAEGDIRIPHDGMMSTRHAEVVREPGLNCWTWAIVDLQSTNGTFVRVASAPLTHGTIFLLGSTVLRFDDAALNLPGAVTDAGGSMPTKTQGWKTLAATDLKASLVQVLPEGNGKRYFLDAAEHWLGRDAGQAAIVLADDVQIDPRHAKVAKDAKGNWSLGDGGSLNGVWLRVERHVVEGTCEFQLGEQRFALLASASNA